MMERANKKTTTDWWMYLYPILFGLGYSQAVLFFSNQNTRFIPGLALVGYGDVASDWMAHITNAFPLFTLLFKWQYQLLGLYAGVHLSYLIILAVYALSGIWLAKTLFGQNTSNKKAVLLFSLFWLIVHTTGVRDFLRWYIPEGLGNQWMMANYYEAANFGIFLLVGIAAYISGRPILAAICFLLSTLFHTAYLIPSATIAGALVILPANQSLNISVRKRVIFFSIVGVALTIFAIWSMPLLTSGDSQIRTQAHQIMAEVRIPHHTDILKWHPGLTRMFFVAGIAAVILARKKLIGQLLFVELLFVSAAMLWVIVFNDLTVAVAAPWRVSVILGPLSWIVLLAAVAKWVAKITAKSPFFSQRVLIGVLLTVGIAASFFGIQDVVQAYELKPEERHYPISRFLEDYHVPGNQYLIPVKHFYFRLEAGVPVYIDWKSHPVVDSEFLEWYERIKMAESIYDGKPKKARSNLELLIESQSVTHMIWYKPKGDFPFPQMGRQVYEDEYYSLWDLRMPAKE